MTTIQGTQTTVVVRGKRVVCVRYITKAQHHNTAIITYTFIIYYIITIFVKFKKIICLLFIAITYIKIIFISNILLLFLLLMP